MDTALSGTPANIDAIQGVSSFRSPKIAPRRKRRVGGPPLQLFESGEHVYIGDTARLRFSPDGPGIVAGDVELPLPNGLALTYGRILALGGDFYGLPDMPISDGGTPQRCEARFAAAFATLAEAPEAATEAPQILAVMDEEIAAVDAARLAGDQPSAAYAALGDSLSLQWNKITGGGTVKSPFGRYLKLAATNWDHFGQHAVIAYQAGHRIAMLTALQARDLPTEAEREEALKSAYAVNAFADHFMTDLFSAGHMRTPRKALYEISYFHASASGYVARYMHDEDCMWGLYVANARGDRWLAYGDKKYADTYDSINAALVDEATQASIDEVYGVFLSGIVPEDPAAYAALQIAPDLARLQVDRADPRTATNYAAFFIDRNDQVLARGVYRDLDWHDWTSNWTVPSTLYSQKEIAHVTPPPFGFIAAPTTAPEITAWTSTQPNQTWSNGRRVRYAVSYYYTRHQALNESDLGPWCDYAVLDGQFEPTITVPIDPSNLAQGRRIYRQFEGEYPQLIGAIADNTTDSFTDDSGN